MRTRNRANQKVGQSGPNKECRAQSYGGELYDCWCRVAPWIYKPIFRSDIYLITVKADCFCYAVAPQARCGGHSGAILLFVRIHGNCPRAWKGIWRLMLALAARLGLSQPRGSLSTSVCHLESGHAGPQPCSRVAIETYFTGYDDVTNEVRRFLLPICRVILVVRAF